MARCSPLHLFVIYRILSLENKFSDAYPSTYRIVSTIPFRSLITNNINSILVMNLGHCLLNIWRDSLNKESVSGRLLTIESLLSDGSKLILTLGCSSAPLQIFNPFVNIMTYVHESRLHSAKFKQA